MESQKIQILNYLQTHVGITQKEAIDMFGCYRLGARVYDLRHDGHNIMAIQRKEKNRYGKTVQFAEYRIVKKINA